MSKRIEKQRRLVNRLGAQLAFEILVLDRLEERAVRRPGGAGSVGSVLRAARLRRAEALVRSSKGDEEGS